MPPYAIGIVGAGTAGAATAILLARAGHAVTVFERVADPMIGVERGVVRRPMPLAERTRLLA